MKFSEILYEKIKHEKSKKKERRNWKDALRVFYSDQATIDVCENA